ncbi:subtilase-type protease inhibitor [Actinomycetota bacterium Odt1-20B]
MRCVLTTLTAAATLAVGALATAAGTAQAEPAKPTSLYAPSALVLTLSQGDQATAPVSRAVTLTCTPKASGSHPAPSAACAELRGVSGEFGQLVNAAPTGACTKEWKPQMVTVDGVWEGRRVSWTTTFGNGCEMRNALANGVALSF